MVNLFSRCDKFVTAAKEIYHSNQAFSASYTYTVTVRLTNIFFFLFEKRKKGKHNPTYSTLGYLSASWMKSINQDSYGNELIP